MNQRQNENIVLPKFVNQPVALDEQFSNRIGADLWDNSTSSWEFSQRPRDGANLIYKSTGVLRRVLRDVVGGML